MERGNYDYPLGVTGADEIGYLASRFQEMRQQPARLRAEPPRHGAAQARLHQRRLPRAAHADQRHPGLPGAAARRRARRSEPAAGPRPPGRSDGASARCGASPTTRPAWPTSRATGWRSRGRTTRSTSWCGRRCSPRSRRARAGRSRCGPRSPLDRHGVRRRRPAGRGDPEPAHERDPVHPRRRSRPRRRRTSRRARS